MVDQIFDVCKFTFDEDGKKKVHVVVKMESVEINYRLKIVIDEIFRGVDLESDSQLVAVRMIKEGPTSKY